MLTQIRLAAARPTGTNRGTTAGPVLYYSFDVPPRCVTFTATPTGSWDPTPHA
jgi:hypothetical protein